MADTISIRHATYQIKWKFLFANKDVFCQVNIFNKSFKNIFPTSSQIAWSLKVNLHRI